MITIKSDREIALMREAGNIVMLAHEEIRKAIKPGVSTKELDKIAYDVITSHGATPSFLNYNGFPGTICASKQNRFEKPFFYERKTKNE